MKPSHINLNPQLSNHHKLQLSENKVTTSSIENISVQNQYFSYKGGHSRI